MTCEHFNLLGIFSKLTTMSSGKYEQLLPDGSRDAESDIGVESSVQQEDRSQGSNNPALPWMISTLVCLGICVILTVQLRKVGESGFGTYESAFFTDISKPILLRLLNVVVADLYRFAVNRPSRDKTIYRNTKV
jgi:hypothetical protein